MWEFNKNVPLGNPRVVQAGLKHMSSSLSLPRGKITIF